MRKPSCFVIWTMFVLGVFLLANCGNKVERSIKKLASAKKEERDTAFMELMLAKGNAIPPLIEALGDEDAWARWYAAWTLGNIASKVQDEAALAPAIPPLIEALQDPDAKVREAAAQALEQIGTPEAKAAVEAYRE